MKKSNTQENVFLNSTIKNSQTDAEKNGLTKSRIIKTKKRNYQNFKIKRMFSRILKTPMYKTFTILFVIYILFSHDLRHFMANKDTDFGFYIMTTICIIFFIFDIIALFICDDEYKFSLVCYCEIISTLTLFLDLGWIYNSFFNTPTAKSYSDNSIGAQYAIITLKAQTYLYFLFYIRLFRLTYCLKFNYIFYSLKNTYLSYRSNTYEKSARNYVPLDSDNSFEEEIAKKNDDEGLKKDIYKYIHPKIDDFDIKKYKEIYGDYQINRDTEPEIIHNTGEELSQLNTKTLIVILLLITSLYPIFSIRTYWNEMNSQITAIETMGYFLKNEGYNTRFEDMMNTFENNFDDNNYYNLIQITVYQNEKGKNTNKKVLRKGKKNYSESYISEIYRSYEIRVFQYPENIDSLNHNDYFITAYFNLEFIPLNFMLNIFRTIFSMFILLWITFFIFRDMNKLIINPMKEMMQKIKRIQVNPVLASKEAEEEQIKLDVIIKKNRWRRIQEREKKRYETSLLINTLVKSGALLALGFGEAGIEIIINNLQKDKLNPLIKGNKVICLFGFCDIRYFASATEELREGVLKFVNEVAEIVHYNIDKYGGSCNKNLGDAFLIVWKFKNDEIEQFISYDDNSKEIVDIKLKDHVQQPKITYRCELAILSFIETLIELKRSKRLNKYSNNLRLKKKIPGFEIKMGFGLHLGWAIEGAIGSHHKIDASYLSPHVNLSSRLLAATKQFKVDILISGQVVEKISKDNAKRLRLLDIVNVKGSKKAIKMYTLDLFIQDLSKREGLNEKIKNLPNKGIRKRVKLDITKRINKFQNYIFKKNHSTKGLLINHPEIKRLRRKFTKEFFQTWKRGFDFYIGGNWTKAYECFSRTKNMVPTWEDGPSNTLLSYMKNRNLQAPDDWKGVRKLTSK